MPQPEPNPKVQELEGLQSQMMRDLEAKDCVISSLRAELQQEKDVRATKRAEGLAMQVQLSGEVAALQEDAQSESRRSSRL